MSKKEQCPLMLVGKLTELLKDEKVNACQCHRVKTTQDEGKSKKW